MFIALFVFFYSCKKDSCLEDAGPISKTQKALESFDRVAVFDNIHINLIQGNNDAIEIEAGKNLQPYITSEITDGTLSIKNSISCQWLRKPKEKIMVNVYFKKLNKVICEGYGNVHSANMITTDEFTFDSKTAAGIIDLWLYAKKTFVVLTGSTDVTIKGKVNECIAECNMRSKMDFSSLEVQKLQLNFLSVFDGYVHVKDSMIVNVAYKGNLYYKGNPSYIKSTISNSGRLISIP